MSLHIGQIRYNVNDNYLSTEGIFSEDAILLSEYKTSFRIFGEDIKDAYLNFSDGSCFNSKITYFLNIKVAKRSFDQDIRIKLVNDEYKSYYTAGAEVTGDFQLLSERVYHIPAVENEFIDSVEEADESIENYDYGNEKYSYETISLIFTPNADIYNNLIIELDRTGIQNLGTSAIVDIQETEDYKVLQKIVPISFEGKGSIEKIKEIGIQGNPGLLFAINGEPFRLGKTGTFILADEDFVYTFIGFCCSNKFDTFILDYKYES